MESVSSQNSAIVINSNCNSRLRSILNVLLSRVDIFFWKSSIYWVFTRCKKLTTLHLPSNFRCSTLCFSIAGENVESCEGVGQTAAKVYPIILIQVDLDLILVAVQATLVVLLLVPILLVQRFQKDLVPRIGKRQFRYYSGGGGRRDILM